MVEVEQAWAGLDSAFSDGGAEVATHVGLLQSHGHGELVATHVLHFLGKTLRRTFVRDFWQPFDQFKSVRAKSITPALGAHVEAALTQAMKRAQERFLQLEAQVSAIHATLCTTGTSSDPMSSIVHIRSPCCWMCISAKGKRLRLLDRFRISFNALLFDNGPEVSV